LRRRRIATLVGAVAAAVLTAVPAAVLALTRPFTRPKQLDGASNSLSVYGADLPAGLPVVSPFHLDNQPMKALVLFNFERDPDRIYRGLEPQAFDDDEHGTGRLVIGWRVDGRVDVFHDPGLRLDPATYGITGSGLHRMEVRDLSEGHLEVGPTGAQVDLSFTDLEDRPVRLLATEADARRRRPFSLLAPMGSAAIDPPALPLVFVKDFYFVRRAGSEVRIEIDGREHRSDTIPLVLDGTRMRFVRYSARPAIALWNSRDHATADVLVVDGSTAGSRGVRYDLQANGPFLEIRRMSCREGEEQLSVEFAPAVPHLLALADRSVVEGDFHITTEPPAGVVTGTWRVAREGQRLEFDLTPSGGWTPGDAQPMARLLFRLVPVFRRWPATYRWHATMDLPDGDEAPRGPLPLTAGWERTG